jgi:hypothetical protein
MKQPRTSAENATDVKRRDVLVLGVALLSGCGGGVGSGDSSTITASAPGTGGTGISVQGTITGFGSIIVNGTKYDDSAASVRMDGANATSSALRVGMVASVRCSKSSASVGTASDIEVWSIARGAITQLVGTDSFVIAGVTVQTGASTSYEGCANYAGLSAAQLAGVAVTVWGIQASADATQWSASRVLVSTSPATDTVSTGRVHVSGAQVTLNGWTLVGSGVSALQDQALVRVQGNTGTPATTLNVVSIKVFDAAALLNQAEAEVEGVVTAYTSNSNFSVGTVTVNAGAARISPSAATVAVGTKVSVSGSLVNGVLIAKEMEVSSTPPSSAAVALDITGLIDEFDSAREFDVRGQQCDARTADVFGGTLSDLARGKKVRVVGLPQGEETLVLTQLYFL